MLRSLPVLVDGKKRSIGLQPYQVTFVEELEKNKCNIVVMIAGKQYIYICPKPYKYLMNFANLTPFNLFIEN